jgi:aspartate dehydrogenase
VADQIRAGAAGDVEIVGVLVRDVARYRSTAATTGWRFTARLEELLAAAPEVVAELAGHDALRAHGERVLRAGIDLLTISAGAFADDALCDRLLAAAEAGGSRIILPSGAIAGLDGIGSAATLGIDRVTHTVRKPPVALLPDDEAAAVIAEGAPRELYRGPAREAARRFPANVNVVAMVSLAGIGLDRTEAVVVADPAVVHNTHEVVAEGPFGSIEVRVRNVPSPDNPKTGRITPGSVVHALRRRSARLLVGG